MLTVCLLLWSRSKFQVKVWGAAELVAEAEKYDRCCVPWPGRDVGEVGGEVALGIWSMRVV